MLPAGSYGYASPLSKLGQRLSQLRSRVVLARGSWNVPTHVSTPDTVGSLQLHREQAGASGNRKCQADVALMVSELVYDWLLTAAQG